MEKSIGRLISILYRKGQVYLNAALKPLNLTASELPFLTCLYRSDGKTQEELSSFLAIDKAATARAVRSLSDKGLLRKERDEGDRRANRIFLTERAVCLQSAIRGPLRKWSMFLSENLEEQAVGDMLGVLNNMVQKVEKADLREIWKN